MVKSRTGENVCSHGYCKIVLLNFYIKVEGALQGKKSRVFIFKELRKEFVEESVWDFIN